MAQPWFISKLQNARSVGIQSTTEIAVEFTI